MPHARFLATPAVLLLARVIYSGAQPSAQSDVPRTWDDTQIARHQIPLARASASPKHVSADYYYRVPVRPIYKSYPVYAPGREPSGDVSGRPSGKTARCPRCSTSSVRKARSSLAIPRARSGHLYGLNLSGDDRQALIAFLKAL
jgi:hypothetical protein